jgi:hypothetical protein
MPPSLPLDVTAPVVTVWVEVATVTVLVDPEAAVAPPSPPVPDVSPPVSSPQAAMAATPTTLKTIAVGRASRAFEPSFLSMVPFYASRGEDPSVYHRPMIRPGSRLHRLLLGLASVFSGGVFGGGLLGGCGGEDAGDPGAGGGGGGRQMGATASTGEAEVCPWPGDDPGNLVATGNAVGSVIADVGNLVDQCGIARSLWDFAGGYRIVVLAEGW